MKPLIVCALTLPISVLIAAKAKADIAGATFSDFERMCQISNGIFETWNNRKLGTCIYPGSGSAQNPEEWFWASQENIKNSFDTYKSGGSFNNALAAHKNMMKQMKLQCTNQDESET